MTKLPSQHSMSGHHRHACEMPFKWRFAGGSLMAHLYRVGSHVVFAWIHCTDVRIHCTDILIECR